MRDFVRPRPSGLFLCVRQDTAIALEQIAEDARWLTTGNSAEGSGAAEEEEEEENIIDPGDKRWQALQDGVCVCVCILCPYTAMMRERAARMTSVLMLVDFDCVYRFHVDCVRLRCFSVFRLSFTKQQVNIFGEKRSLRLCYRYVVAGDVQCRCVSYAQTTRAL